MNGSSLIFDNPIRDAISRVRFAPASNSLLVASWDSILRLYDVDECELRLETPSGGGALLDCCFESESVALTANSDGSVVRYDMRLGNSKAIGNHEDSATCVEYSEETCQIITSGWDNSVKFWDARSPSSVGCLSNLVGGVESMSLSAFSLMVALKSSVHIYDLRYLNRKFQVKEPFVDIHIKCVRSSSSLGGLMIGFTDGRVALEYFGESSSQKDGTEEALRYGTQRIWGQPPHPKGNHATKLGVSRHGDATEYGFKCHPKNKDGRYHLVAVNDIAFNPVLCSVFITGDNEGHATIWDVQSRQRLMELPRYPNSVASLAYNHNGQVLAVASSYTYQETNEREEMPQIFLHQMDDIHYKSSAGSGPKR